MGSDSAERPRNFVCESATAVHLIGQPENTDFSKERRAREQVALHGACAAAMDPHAAIADHYRALDAELTTGAHAARRDGRVVLNAECALVFRRAAGVAIGRAVAEIRQDMSRTFDSIAIIGCNTRSAYGRALQRCCRAHCRKRKPACCCGKCSGASCCPCASEGARLPACARYGRV